MRDWEVGRWGGGTEDTRFVIVTRRQMTITRIAKCRAYLFISLST